MDGFFFKFGPQRSLTISFDRRKGSLDVLQVSVSREGVVWTHYFELSGTCIVPLWERVMYVARYQGQVDLPEDTIRALCFAAEMVLFRDKE